MLSPSGNSPGRIDGEKEDEPVREDRSPPAEEVTGQEEATQNIAATPEVKYITNQIINYLLYLGLL